MVVATKGSTPPNPPAKAEERKSYESDQTTKDALSTVIWWYRPMGMTMLYIPHFIEIYVLLSFFLPNLSLSTLDNTIVNYASPSSDAFSNLRITPTFLLGTLSIFTGAILRLTCYQYLGKQFTFELSFRKNDKLITGGPYSIVRHPSYLGSVLVIDGMMICQFSEGGWWREYGVGATRGGVVWTVVVMAVVAVFELGLVRRTQKEDRMLRKEFRSQWEEWARRTKYKMIPGIY
ncbi:hypothetical protein QCA50_007805 [Cerrena zonata]|uniref:Protein-S-isoprenylcysteine O-methyltransferase n=1 Tax=Cerrena zonata TaxID=2478898 RepID=A0AAW0GBT9_9APHY